jgi:hypothetical protein
MSAYDEGLADVNAKLRGIADVSSTLPPWHDAWMRLRPGSTAEDRLAVYQAIRDSGHLSDPEGFYLVSWQIEAMADLEAETRLRDLGDAMQAIEKENGVQQGDPWPDDQAPPVYEELSRQYQDAWDAIFVGKLQAFGEQDIADLYQADPDEFARCYERGLQSFQEPVDARNAVSPDDLVRVASCRDLPRADLAQMALARAGIPAALGNANFLYWFWHCGNAVGGVTVHVRRRDAIQARKVLAAARDKVSENLPSWTCSSCGQRIAGQWDACWHCGCLADGTPSNSIGEQLVVQPEHDAQADGWQNWFVLVGAAVGVVLPLLLMRYHLKQPLLLIPLVFVFFFLLWLHFPRWPSDATEEEELSEAPSRSFPRTRSSVSGAIVQRAWQAAVIAILVFPPLAFYSMRLLWKLGQRDTPLSCTDSCRTWMAFSLNIVAILACLLFGWWIPLWI